MPITREQLANLSREQKIALIQQASAQQSQVQPAQPQAAPQIDPTKMTREQKIAFIQQNTQQGQMSAGEAAKIKLGEGVSLGFRPAIAGLGAGAGAAVGTLERGGGLMEALRAGGRGYTEAKKEALAESEKAAKDQPAISAMSEIAGGLATLPFTAVRGATTLQKLRSAGGLGALVGLGKGVSKGDTTTTEGVGEILKSGATGGVVGATTEGVLGAAGKAVKAVGKTETVKSIKEGIKNIISKGGEATTGLKSQEIRTLIDKGDEVAKIVKKAGDDFTPETDKLSKDIFDSLKNTREAANKKISEELKGKAGDKLVDVDKYLNLARGSKKATNQIMSKVKIDQATGRREISFRDLQDLKVSLDDAAQATFKGRTTNVFPGGNQEARKAADIANTMRKDIAGTSSAINEANKKLTQLHTIDKNLNKNIFKEGRSETYLLGAGRGTNKANESMLKRIGEITETTPLEKARILSAAKAYKEAPIVSADVTGKGAERFLKVTNITPALAGALGIATGGPITGAIAVMATSPKALTSAIRAGQLTQDLAQAVFEKATPQVKSLLIQQFGKSIGKKE